MDRTIQTRLKETILICECTLFRLASQCLIYTKQGHQYFQLCNGTKTRERGETTVPYPVDQRFGMAICFEGLQKKTKRKNSEFHG